MKKILTASIAITIFWSLQSLAESAESEVLCENAETAPCLILPDEAPDAIAESDGGQEEVLPTSTMLIAGDMAIDRAVMADFEAGVQPEALELIAANEGLAQKLREIEFTTLEVQNIKNVIPLVIDPTVGVAEK